MMMMMMMMRNQSSRQWDICEITSRYSRFGKHLSRARNLVIEGGGGGGGGASTSSSSSSNVISSGFRGTLATEWGFGAVSC